MKSPIATIEQLEQELAHANTQRIMAVALLTTLIREKHNGRAFISIHKLAESSRAQHQLNCQEHRQLGTIALTVLDKDGIALIGEVGQIVDTDATSGTNENAKPLVELVGN